MFSTGICLVMVEANVAWNWYRLTFHAFHIQNCNIKAGIARSTSILPVQIAPDIFYGQNSPSYCSDIEQITNTISMLYQFYDALLRPYLHIVNMDVRSITWFAGYLYLAVTGFWFRVWPFLTFPFCIWYGIYYLQLYVWMRNNCMKYMQLYPYLYLTGLWFRV